MRASRIGEVAVFRVWGGEERSKETGVGGQHEHAMYQTLRPADGILVCLNQVPYSGHCVDREQAANRSPHNCMRRLLAASGVVVQGLAEGDFCRK